MTSGSRFFAGATSWSESAGRARQKVDGGAVENHEATATLIGTSLTLGAQTIAVNEAGALSGNVACVILANVDLLAAYERDDLATIEAFIEQFYGVWL